MSGNITEHEALLLAVRAHDGQYRKQVSERPADPYVVHPIRVASRLQAQRLRVVALLHDVLEDTDVTELDLRAAGVPDSWLLDLKALTRHEDETYKEFIRRVIARGGPAIRVKLADIADNLSDLPEDPEWAGLRQRYHDAREVLSRALA